MSRRTAAGLVVAGALVALVLTAGLELAAGAGGYGRELVPGPVWIHAVMGASISVLTATLVHLGRGRLAAGCAVFAGCALVAALLRAYVHWAYAAPPAGSGDALLAVVWVTKVTSVVPELFATYTLVLYPTGRLVEGWWGRLSVVAVVASSISGAMQFLGPGTLDFIPVIGLDGDNSVLEGRHVLAAPGIGPWLEPYMAPAVAIAVVVFFPIELVTPVVRLRRSTGVEREQLYWILWAVAAIGLLAAADTIVREGTLDAWVVGVGSSVLALAMAVGLLDQTRVSGEELLAGTVLYGSLWVLVLGLDLAFLSALSFALGDSLAEQDVILLVLLLSAVLYAPLRAAVWRLVRRLLLGRREDPYDVVAGLAAGLEQADEGSDQLVTVARAVAHAFGVSYVAVEVERTAGSRLTATVGVRPRETRALPIAYRGREVGRLVLPARGLRTRLSRRDEALLGDLIRQAAVAARTTQLADALQDDRERLVMAREEERRRLRRDLHDGLGPSLGGAVFQLDSARLTVDRDPAAAVEQLRATETHLVGVMDDVRRLVSDLRPPALDALGLVGALRQQGDLLPAVEVRVEAAGGIGDLPAAVEVAAYRIVGEALTNVVRHARASHCTVRLAVDDGQLLAEVADDGVGIAADREAGVGLLSLRERADELGGRTEITCPPSGGTVVRAWLPLAPADPDHRPAPDPAHDPGTTTRPEESLA